jgi:nucleotide-binding universal stress UspA family protein
MEAVMYKRILVPVDLDDLSIMDKVFDLIRVSFSQDQASNIRLINVQPIVPVSILGYLPPSFDEDMDHQVQTNFDRLLSERNLSDHKVTKIIRRGSVSDEILAESKDWSADIIIIGSHRPSMTTYLLGSNAASIVRHAKCSVLVIR